MLARLLLAAALATACHAMAQSRRVHRARPVASSASRRNWCPSPAPKRISRVWSTGLPPVRRCSLPSCRTAYPEREFHAAAALTPTQVAQILETARQQLIGLGIGTPTAEQLGFALMGGVVPTALGGTQVPGALNPTTQNLPSPAAQIQGQASAGATAPTTRSPTASTYRPPRAATTAATATLPRHTSDSAIPAGATSHSVAPLTSASPTVNTSASPLTTTPVQAPTVAPAPPDAGAFPQVPAPHATDRHDAMGSVLYLDGRLRRHARVELVRKEKGVEKRRAESAAQPAAQPSAAGLQLLGHRARGARLADRRREGLFRGVLPRRAARAALDPRARLGLQQPDAAAFRPGAERRPAGAARRIPHLPGGSPARAPRQRAELGLPHGVRHRSRIPADLRAGRLDARRAACTCATTTRAPSARAITRRSW